MMRLKLFYNCSFFEDKIDDSSFIVEQQCLKLNRVKSDGKAVFKKILETYKCVYKLSDNFDATKPAAIICIKDNSELLSYTIENIIKFKADKYVNFIVVDDRSEEKLEKIIHPNFSYFRIDGSNGFSFSMLNNIPAKILQDLGCGDIILWNSDLWCMDEETLPYLISKHKDLSSTITGTKLIYPPMHMSLNGQKDSENIKKMFPDKTNGYWRNTVQFGGDFYSNGSFHHYGRFRDPHDYRINCNRPASFITGAFQIINLKSFVDLGGLNPSLQKNFQDNDFCFKVLESGGKIYYCGKNCGFYHDESAILHDKKIDNTFKSNQVLFHKIWNEKLKDII